MDFTEKQLESLLSNEFVIDCIQIKLIQQQKVDPIEYSGSGSIFQKEDGNFRLKLYHSFSNPLKEAITNIGGSIPGKVISKEHYFRMEATDLSENLWTAQDISISKEGALPAFGVIINCIIRVLSCERDNFNIIDNSAFMLLVLPGKYNIPYNHVENNSRGGRSLNTCKIDIFGINIEIKDSKDCIIIRAEDPAGNMNFSFKDRFVEALCICFGKLCPILYSSLVMNKSRVSVLSSIPSNVSNQMITSPIKLDSKLGVVSFKEFIEKYIKTFKKENEIFFATGTKLIARGKGV